MLTPRRNSLRALLVLVSLLLLAGCSMDTSSEDEPATSSVFIENKGSDTIVNLALAWAEAYHSVQPAVSVSVTGGGSGTGIAALINGTVDIANASRRIKEEEIANAEANGILPVEHVIARDAIAVIIHPDNPVDQLTIEQISGIYSGEITRWSDIGGEDRPIVCLSRETNSGTHVYFLEQVIRKGDPDDTTFFSPSTLLLPSSEGISAEVRQNPNAIGYDGLGYVTEEMKVVAVAKQAGGDFILPSIETVNNESYPIARDLYMYTAGEPGGEVREYLEWILGMEAQQIVSDLGFVPVQSGN